MKANVARIIGIIFFVVSFFLPAATDGPAESFRDYLFASGAYHGWSCAAWTLYGTVAFVASLFGPDRVDGSLYFFMISGWITPIVAFGIFIDNEKAKRTVAGILPFLMLFPWLFFATRNPGWGPGPFRPIIGHYVWTVGCLLIFAPEFAKMLTALKGETRDEGSSSNDVVA